LLYGELIESSPCALFLLNVSPVQAGTGEIMDSVAHSPLTRKLSAFVALSEAELAVLERLHQRRRSFVAGQDLVHQGQSGQAAYILSEGWVCSYKIQADGTRQIVDFQIPGDFLGLRSVLLRTSDHSFEPINDIQAAEVLASDLLQAIAETPRLATAILWAASRDEAMVVEHLVGIGRRDADARMAHFLLELGSRLSLVGIGSREGYDCPLTQYHLADALGLSAVHVNRVLRQLREGGLVTFREGRVTFHDRERLVDLAEFDPGYLDQSGPLLK
jgi:CRP-like cAMP-binding protein